MRKISEASGIQELIDSLSYHALLVDENHNLVFINKVAAQAYKHNTDKSLSTLPRKCYEVVHKTNCAHQDCPMPEAIASGNEVQCVIREPNGRWVRINVFPTDLAADDGKRLYLNTVVDATQTIKDNTVLTLRGELLDQIVDSVYVLKDDGAIIYANKTAWESRGYTQDEILGLNIREITAPKIVPEISERILKIKKEGFARFETIHTRKDGSTFPVETRARTVRFGDIDGIIVIARDITKRKQFESRLLEHYSTLEAIIESASGPVFSVDTNYRYTSFNKAHASVMKAIYNAEIELGQSILDYMTVEEDRITAKNNLDRALRGECLTEEAFSGEEELARLYFEVSHSPIVGPDGKVAGVAVYAHNITERKAVEETLRGTRDYLENLLEYANAPVIVWDTGKKITLFNKAFERLTGYSADMVIGQNLDMLFPEGSKRLSLEMIEKAGKGEHWETVEIPILRKDGSVRVALWNSANIYAKDGKTLIATIAQGQDITDRKRMETEVIHERDTAQMYLDIVGVIIVALDTNGNVVLINKRGVELLGCPEEEIIGRNWIDNFLPLSVRATTKDVFLQIMKGDIKKPTVFTNPVITKSGDERIIAWRNTYIKDEDGRVTHSISSGEDITDYEAAREEVRMSYKRLENIIDGVVITLAETVATKDPYTAGHQERVAKLATAIAIDLGLPKRKVKGITMAATVHDIGKIYVPAEILNKPGRLEEIEMSLIKMHAETGYGILKDIDFEEPIAEIVLQHHERLDGTGYPSGLKGESISSSARIIAVADVVEAMSSHRPYRPALGLESALDEITNNRKTLYDEEVVDSCLALFKSGRFSF